MKKTKEMYNHWNKEKQDTEFFVKKKKRALPGEIWVGKIGMNIGTETSKDKKGQRPFLIIKNYLGGDLVGIVPMTTHHNENYKDFYFEIFNYKKYGLDRKSYYMLNQYRVVSTKRLVKKINNVEKMGEYFPRLSKNILKKIKNLLMEIHFA